MASGRKAKSGKRSKKGGLKQNWDGIVAGRYFAPVAGLWGAALGWLSVAVTPEALIASLTEGTFIATLETPVQTLLAGGAAMVFGCVLFAVAHTRSAAARRHNGPNSILTKMNRKVHPIDPVRDLGSRSIDEPVETMPFVTPAWRDADVEDAEEELPVVPRVMREAEPEPEVPALNAPRELDLAQFAELPGRNAVWVEEPLAPAAPVAAERLAAPRPVAAPVVAAVPDPALAAASPRRPAAVPPVPGAAALARLRALPPGELSMVEMVERFAGALHEHRTNAPARTLTAAELAAREAALAEALKALAALSGIGAEPAPVDRDEPLRDALRQLQPRRGAA